MLATFLRLVQLNLQIPDVVYDVLENLHLACLFVCGQCGYKLFQFAVAAIHILQEDGHLLVQQRDLALRDGRLWSDRHRTMSSPPTLLFNAQVDPTTFILMQKM